MLGATAAAAAVYFLAVRLIGWRGWFLLAPLLLLLWIDPAWGAVFFLAVAGTIAAAVIIYVGWRVLPYAIFFAIGIWMAWSIVVGLGALVG